MKVALLCPDVAIRYPFLIICMHPMSFGTLFIDFRKAFDMFDMVDNSLLMKKLAHYRLNITSLNWFRSYLSTRVQSIMSDDRIPNS